MSSTRRWKLRAPAWAIPTTRFCPRRWSAGRPSPSAMCCRATCRSSNASTAGTAAPIPRGRITWASSSTMRCGWANWPSSWPQGQRRLGAAFRSGEAEPLSRTDRLHPGRIINQTNGVTPRRWLRMANRPLSSLITEPSARAGKTDLDRLPALEPHAETRASARPSTRPSARTRWRCRTGSAPRWASVSTRRACSTCRSSASTNTSASF
jgi:hypothetical protein